MCIVDDRLWRGSLFFAITAALLSATAFSQDPFIPRRQSKPPGPPLSPQQALEKMTVPDGFHVELVASEPDLLNPVAMAFDDRGRIFVTESFEYPRREPGPGRDRIKILEDTTGDGRADKVTIFAEGLNIPSGIAIGYGGVWVANAPDILFLEDTDGDDKADRQTVVATGFGRDDTHELPNALTWGPDGFLYGLNGVFNRSVVKQDDRTLDFTCAMFRIDPITHRLDLFCEGTSNPWGIAFDNEGSAFISACVIDHLWHLTETGYYHRQGGPYPPHTWKIESIVDYKHQMAAYCGIEYFDSPAYPASYRNKLYMGNIHGGCINVDSVVRQGSTYRGSPHDDFLTANDVWFMPVAQKVGPDGCLYVLDWYDRYHCYQDASADPKGVDRGHGRLYRVVYQERPAVSHGDLNALPDSQLIDLLTDLNIFYRQRASILLAQRLRADSDETRKTSIVRELTKRLLEDSDQNLVGLFPLTTLLFAPSTDATIIEQLLEHADPLVVSWTIRAAATRRFDQPSIVQKIASHASHKDPRVRLQVAIAAGKIAGTEATSWLITVLNHSTDDGLLPKIVWRNLESNLMADQAFIAQQMAGAKDESQSLLVQLAPRIATRLLAAIKPDLSSPADAASLTSVLNMADSLSRHSPRNASQVLESLLGKLRTGEIRPNAAKPTLQNWSKSSADTDSGTNSDIAAIQLKAFAGEAKSIENVRLQTLSAEQPLDRRKQLLETLASVSPALLASPFEQWLQDQAEGASVDGGWRDSVLDTVIIRGNGKLKSRLLDALPQMPPGIQARVAERMSQREETSLLLLDSILSEKIPRDIVSPNQIRLLASSKSPSVRQKTASVWGTIRTEASATRQPVVDKLTQYLMSDARGDARRGLAVYDRICGQCHVLHKQGYEVGPDITRNGRGNFEQLVVSVFDPSLVIGDAYKSVSVLTVDGRVISGIITEQSEQRVVLKIQGGKQEVIPTIDIEELKQNPQSLMPEGLENQMTLQEVADLFALLSLENPIDASENQTIKGTPEKLHP
jgi:putative membrane-bound dehydrogenase-like protein